VPAGQTVVQEFPSGMTFAGGLSFRIVGGFADADATVIGANEVSVTIAYI
jgi:acyl CoA:acetate/3-ketoacid CoA transferase beta subunit